MASGRVTWVSLRRTVWTGPFMCSGLAGGGVLAPAHSTVMPSRRIIAMNPVMEKKIAMAVSPYVTAERSSTKERSDDEMSNQNTSPR